MFRFSSRFLFLIAIITASYSSVSALIILSTDNEYFRPNYGVARVNNLDVTIQQDKEITKEKGFSLILPEDANFRFSASSLFFIQMSGSGANKVLKSPALSPDLRKITFQVTDDFVKGDNFTISGIEIVVYHRPNGYRGIGLDVTGDSIMDAQSSNGIRIDETYGLEDKLPPHEAFNVVGIYESPNLTLTATPPGDVDFSHYLVSFIDSSGSLISEKAENSLNKTTLAVPANAVSMKIKTRDIRENNSTGLQFPISFFAPSAQTSSTLTGSTSTGTTQTGSVTQTGTTTQTGITTPTTSTGALYVPTNPKAKSFATALDAYIAKKKTTKSDANKLLETRNTIIRLVERFYTTKGIIPRRAIVKELKTAVLTLKTELKK